MLRLRSRHPVLDTVSSPMYSSEAFSIISRPHYWIPVYTGMTVKEHVVGNMCLSIAN